MSDTVKVQEFRTLARDWEAFGHSDPLFGILSDPTKYGGKWDVAEFFASGQAHVDKLFRILASLNITYGTGACLDFGCGVGRLTVPLSGPFERTVGVDVAPSMIQRAREFHHARSRCTFVVNRAADLGQFPSGTFDLVHSCLVLQHIPPAISLGYVREFFRVARPGGLIVFQLPAETVSESAITQALALPENGYAAAVIVADPPTGLTASQHKAVRVQVTNVSGAVWAHDIPAGRHICVANHWLHEDGTVAVADDGRARLPETLAPGQSVDIELVVTAPAGPGRYLLEIDLVQELVCWFAQKGSTTGRLAVKVDTVPTELAAGSLPERDRQDRSRQGSPWLRKIVERFRPPRRPSFSMYTVPRHEVEAVIDTSGGRLLEAIDDGAAGAAWRSFTYVCRRLPDSASSPAGR